MNDPYTLTTDRAGEPELGHQSDTPWRRGRDIAPELGGVWTGAFVMGATNSRIVRRTNALLDWAYGARSATRRTPVSARQSSRPWPLRWRRPPTPPS